MPTRHRNPPLVRGCFYALHAVFAVLGVGAIVENTTSDSRRQKTVPTEALGDPGSTGSASSRPVDIPQALVADQPAYVSTGEVPLGHLHSALVLSQDRFAVADGATGVLYFISTTEGLLSESAPGPLPPMVQPVLFTGHLPGGRLAVWRPDRDDAFEVFSARGHREEALIRYPHGYVVGAPVPVGVFPNGNVIVQRRGHQMPPGLIVNHRNSAEDLPAGTVRFEAAGATVTEFGIIDFESVSVSAGNSTTFLNRRIIFGDQMLVAASGTHFLVGRTDFEQVFAYDQKGRLAYTIPIPGERTAVSESDIAAQRYQRIADGSPASRRRMDMDAEFARMMGRRNTPVNKDSLAVLQLSGKDSAPPVDRMLADPSGRVWFRLTPMPTDTITRWCVWSPAVRGFEFWMALPRRERLLDAFPDAVLLVDYNSEHPNLIVKEFTIPATMAGTQSPTCLKGHDS